MPALLEEVKLLFLKKFLESMKSSVSEEWIQIHQGLNDGIFDEYGDLESAYDTPLWHEEFGAESILHLLNAHVERQLFEIALMGGHIKEREIFRSPNFSDLKQRVERTIRASLEDVPGWLEYAELREIVNSLKHGTGIRQSNPKPQSQIEGNSLKIYQAKFAEADRYLEICLTLTRALWASASESKNDG